MKWGKHGSELFFRLDERDRAPPGENTQEDAAADQENIQG